MTSLAERFWAKIIADPDTGCWEWTGSRSPAGYSRIYGRAGLSPLYAHRVSYELCVGPIGEGLTIDHLCRNRGCVNPAHLEVVTMAENARRGNIGYRKLYCKTRASTQWRQSEVRRRKELVPCLRHRQQPCIQGETTS